jgi:hypothetical protein
MPVCSLHDSVPVHHGRKSAQVLLRERQDRTSANHPHLSSLHNVNVIGKREPQGDRAAEVPQRSKRMLAIRVTAHQLQRPAPTSVDDLHRPQGPRDPFPRLVHGFANFSKSTKEFVGKKIGNPKEERLGPKDQNPSALS